uniref:Uncharacterized protein n=1 Tax=Avena sativa TaxID=4498 RepID=A0ACD5YW83_AVESA
MLGKNRKTPLSHISNVFNSVIHVLGVREIHMHGGAYTWSNKQKTPLLEKLDRVLMSADWEDIFPLMQVKKLVSDLSDHCPLLLMTGDCNNVTPKNREFRFDVAWLKSEDFLDKVGEIWKKPVNSVDPIDILNIKLKRFKKHFKMWGSNLFGHMRKKKKELKYELEKLEKIEEHATEYYKNLFGLAPGNMFHMSRDLWSLDETISEEENTMLTAPFSIKEIEEALFSMDVNRAPGPDNIPIEFFQH